MQVSWCKLEVKVAGPKAVTALPPQGEPGHQISASKVFAHRVLTSSRCITPLGRSLQNCSMHAMQARSRLR